MSRPWLSYLLAVVAVSTVTALTTLFLPVLGLTSAALLFLLPVLSAAVRGTGPALLAAGAGAVAYNFFLLPPRYTLRIHGIDNLISLLVLTAVALVTSRLAAQLKAQRASAERRAAQSEEAAALSAVLAKGEPMSALAAGLAFVEARYAKAQPIVDGELPERDAAFSSLDLSAAAWATHNGDTTGHGTHVMPAADWSFVPFGLRRREGGANLLAVARPATGQTRSSNELQQLSALAALLGQTWDRIALERERRERDRLEDRERVRKAFLASLAHDFRTPLTVLTGQLEMVRQRGGDVSEAIEAAAKLNRTMDDLIGAARLEDGSLAAHLEAIDLVDVVDAVDAGPVRSGVSIDRRLPPDLPFVHADAVLLRHVLGNLVENALRHARSLVCISAVLEGERIVISVCDDGPGVPPDQHERIFERFARVEGRDSGSGSGLGLAIVKGFAEAMDARVSVSASPSGGACFHVGLRCVTEALA